MRCSRDCGGLTSRLLALESDEYSVSRRLYVRHVHPLWHSLKIQSRANDLHYRSTDLALVGFASYIGFVVALFDYIRLGGLFVHQWDIQMGNMLDLTLVRIAFH